MSLLSELWITQPVQIYPSHFNPSDLIHLLVGFMIFGGPTFQIVDICIMYQVSYSNLCDQCGSLLTACSISFTMCRGGLPLNIQPRTGSWGAERSCASVQTTSEAVQTASYATYISFPVVVQWTLDPLYPWLHNTRDGPQVSPVAFYQRLQMGPFSPAVQ